MPRQIKYDDLVPFEKVVYNSKIYMYNSPEWNILFPIVDIIRLLKPNTIIACKTGKGQNNIRMYGSQYHHNVFGTELKNKKDYLEALRMVKCIFLYTDTNDHIALSLMNLAKANKIPVVCYSSLNGVYSFFDTSWIKNDFKIPEEVIEHMYTTFDLQQVTKLAELFPEFEILEPKIVQVESTLEKCKKKLNEQPPIIKDSVKFFDPNLARLRKMERDRVKIDYPDDIEKINKKIVDSRTNFLSKFFKKS